ncbi:transforming growth factor-beta-induced protein ig-h3-like [Paramacrobiotus metropolitanus]|uniref:transforming growth factor-beta-induced protein ig-h3-like n=1 Tax=Paramacrobiotus metropolitanus TaxID=2943436 RepID=UPI002445B1D7|nr:transforming growth factor-beta-induced protein ig-h3-like [Paramacrobiotus metropolitanus]
MGKSAVFFVALLLGFGGIKAADVVKRDICLSDPVGNVVQVALQMGQYLFLGAMEETKSLHLLEKTGNITVFLPTNEAFRNVSQETRDFWKKHPGAYKQLMRYHIVKELRHKADLVDEATYVTMTNKSFSGRYVDYNGFSKNIQLYNDAPINSFDYEASNGVIHLLDSVVGRMAKDTIFGIVKKRKDLTKILNAIQIANLTSILNGSQPYTFAAPTDKAIDKLPSGTWDKLLHNPDQLRDVLNYHVASAGTWMTRGLIDNLKIATLNKKADWTIHMDNYQKHGNEKKSGSPGSFIKIDQAKMIAVDLSATNGVVHTISAVLFPPSRRRLGRRHN